MGDRSQPKQEGFSPGVRRRAWAFALTGSLIALTIAACSADEGWIYLAAYAWFGFIFGMLLQRGRFCFSSGFRDLFAVGAPRMIVGLMIATAVFGLSAAAVSTLGMSTFQPAPFGAHSVIAGFVFGVGMVFAGGCASSSFYKVGEGNLTALVVVATMGLTQAVFVSAGGPLGALAPDSWRAATDARELPAAVIGAGAWFDRYLAGYLWNRAPLRAADALRLSSDSAAGAFLGNFLVGALVPALVCLALVYALWVRKGFMKRWKRDGKRPGPRADLAGLWAMLTASPATAVVGVLLGLAAGLHMFVMKGLRLKLGIENAGEILRATGHASGLTVQGTVHDPGIWTVATHSTQWAGWLLNALGWDVSRTIYFGWSEGLPNPLFNLAGWMSIALVGGAAVMALLNDEFSFKRPTLELASFAVFGGVLMGVGARLGLGCNIGAFFSRVGNGDFSGWLFAAGMTGGAWVGVKFFSWWTERKMARELAAAPDLPM